jgi:hypothetical protein
MSNGRKLGPIISNTVSVETTIEALYRLTQDHDHVQRMPSGQCTYCAGIHAAIKCIDEARRGHVCHRPECDLPEDHVGPCSPRLGTR